MVTKMTALPAKKPRTRQSADIALIEFLRPNGYWPMPYSTEMAFQSMRWLVTSAMGDQYVTRHRWHDTCPVGLMGGVSAVNGGGRPVRSLADLRQRFHMALLARDDFRPEVARWREDKGVVIDAVIRMHFRHYKPMSPPAHLPWHSEDGINKSLTQVLEQSQGKILTTQLNSVHAGARVVHRVDVGIGSSGFNFSVHYGFVDPAVDRMDSEWSHCLAMTEGDEPFLDTLARAITAFDELTSPLALAA
jgi:hypothetical protein